MKNGVCPKCGSKEIYFQNLGGPYRGLFVGLRAFGFLGVKLASRNYYVCTACDYIESYLSNPEDIEWIKRNWKKV